MYIFKKAESRDEIIPSLQLRHRVYCIEKKYYEETANGLETDEYDIYSIHFICLNLYGDVVGSLRLINGNLVPLPIEKDFGLYREDGQRVEISRFVVAKEERNTPRIIKGLSEEVYKYVVENTIENCFALVDKLFLIVLRRLGFKIHFLGEEKLYFGHKVKPCLLKVDDYRDFFWSRGVE